MKKLFLLPILFNACFAFANDETLKNRVELTNRQKKLQHEILNYDYSLISNIENELLLRRGCGITRYSQADFYNPEEYPDCAKVFKFLKHYRQQIKQLNEQAEQLYNAIKASPQEQIFNDAAMDGYIKFAETLKETGISKSE